MKKLLLLLSLVLILASCSKPPEVTENLPTADPAEGLNDVPPGYGQTDVASGGDEMNIEDEKFYYYMDFSSWLTEWIFQHAGYYFQAFGIEESPVKEADTEGYELTELDENNWQYPNMAIDYSNEQPDFGSSDVEMAKLAQATIVFMDAYSAACKAYNNGAHVNVSTENAQELHTNMMVAYEDMWAITMDFFYSFDEVTMLKEDDNVKILAEDGFLAHSNALGIVTDAKKIEKLLYELMTQGLSFLDADENEFSAHLESFTGRLNEIITLLKDEQQMEHEGLTDDRKVYMEDLIEDSEIFKGIADDILSMIQAGTADIFEEYTVGTSTDEKFNPSDQLSVMLQNMIYDYNYMVQ